MLTEAPGQKTSIVCCSPHLEDTMGFSQQCNIIPGALLEMTRIQLSKKLSSFLKNQNIIEVFLI